MKVRPRSLPPGWYPAGEAETRKKIASLKADLSAADVMPDVVAGIVPHAGWDYSGSIALDVMRRFDPNVETVVVIGGHLPESAGVLAAFEEALDTPVGILETDTELLDILKSEMRIQEDTRPDNTVEIHLPIVRCLFDEARVLSLRAAPSEEALQLGTLLYSAGKRLSRRLAVFGSTDLTHYGNAYGFTPKGTGDEAVRWVKNVNDKRFLDAVLSMNASKANDLARREGSACSAGGAAASIAYAAAAGVTAGQLVSYRTSWDIMPSSSFVGYAGVLFRVAH